VSFQNNLTHNKTAATHAAANAQISKNLENIENGALATSVSAPALFNATTVLELAESASGNKL
jgi:hypothetical protein